MSDAEVTRGPIVEGPDADGFHAIHFEGPQFATSFGRYLARAEGERTARVRILPGLEQRNVLGKVHGGFTLAFLDQAIFAGPAVLGLLKPGGAVTLSISTQFVGAGEIGKPLDCVMEVVRQTRRLTFLTGTMEQEGAVIFTFQATLRTFSGEGAAA